MKKLLVVVDYQVDFVNGSLGFNGAENLEDKIYKRILKAKECGEDTVFTKDVHFEDYMSTEEGKNLPIMHCQNGSEGAALFGKIKEFENEFTVFEKGSFGSLELGNYIKDKNFEEITIVGLVSYICVFANAVICKSSLPNAHIIVEKDLVGAGDEKAQEIGFEAMKNLHIDIK